MAVYRRRISRRLIAAVAVVAVLVVVVAGYGAWRLTGAGAFGTDGSGVAVKGSLVRVILPDQANASQFRFWTTGPTPDAARSLLGRKAVLVPLAPVRDFHSSRTIPRRGTRLEATLRKGLKAGSVLEASWNPVTHHWEPDNTTYSPRTGVAVATVKHFSVHGFFQWNWDWLGSLFVGMFKNIFGQFIINHADPSCGDPNGVRMYYTNGTKTVVPCHEAQVAQAGPNGSANVTVKLVNTRPYPIDV